MRAVAQMGYQAVEFYAPYFEWTEAQAKQMRKLLDDLGIRCYSTHNNEDYFGAKKINACARPESDSRHASMSCRRGAIRRPDVDGWKAIADKLNAAAEKLEPSGLKVGYHNHQAEWKPVAGSVRSRLLPRTRSLP